MDHALLRAKVTDYFRATTEKGKQRRAVLGPYSAEERDRVEQTLEMLEEGNREYWHLVGSDAAREELDNVFRSTGLPRDDYRDHTPRILDEIRKAKIGVFKAVLEYGQSLESYNFTEPQSAPVSASSVPAAASQGPSVSEAVEAFLREQETTAGVTVNTINKRRAILEVALEWFGPDKPMSVIDKRAAGEFKAALLTLPSNRMQVQRVRGLSLREAMAMKDVPKISNATANAYLSALKVFWSWAETHGYADEALFTNMAIAKRGHEAKDTRPFTQDALEKVYRAVTEPDSRYNRETSHRWATLIAMFCGARQNEVCQLQVRDLRQVDGVWVLDFTDEGSDQKRVKSRAARRRVPVHSHLIELGLLEFREQLEANGEDRLFPDYYYREKHGYGGKLSRWFNRTLVKHLGIKSDAHTFHGLRHTFATRLGQADVPTERIQFIVGHERDGVTHQVYMKEGYTLQQTREAVERFSV